MRTHIKEEDNTMAVLTKKIDFAIIMSVKNANPNGDPRMGIGQERTTRDLARLPMSV